MITDDLVDIVLTPKLAALVEEMKAELSLICPDGLTEASAATATGWLRRFFFQHRVRFHEAYDEADALGLTEALRLRRERIDILLPLGGSEGIVVGRSHDQGSPPPGA